MSAPVREPRVPPGRFGRVAVVMGGWSGEREVSLASGRAVLAGLRAAGVDAHAFDATLDVAPRLEAELRAFGIERAFLILHGPGGEDGTIQAALELAGIPYTGSGVLASALAMDKLRTKALCAYHGLPTPPWCEVGSVDEAVSAARRLRLPMVVKPALEGSSLGVTIVREPGEIPRAYHEAADHGPVLAEAFMPGEEITATVLDGEVLPLVTIRPAGSFYDYAAKYELDTTEYDCPARLPRAVAERIRRLALRAFDVIGCAGWARVDFMLDAAGEPRFIECNTAPGMTGHSLVPMAAAAAGIDMATLCSRILATTLAPDELGAEASERAADRAADRVPGEAPDRVPGGTLRDALGSDVA